MEISSEDIIKVESEDKDVKPEDTAHDNVITKSNKYKNTSYMSKSVYYSDIPGEFINDAITGATTQWKVGSKDEEKFFRVIITSNPSRKKNLEMTRDIHKSFYDSPKAYMDHHKCDLDEDLVKDWEKKHN